MREALELTAETAGYYFSNERLRNGVAKAAVDMPFEAARILELIVAQDPYAWRDSYLAEAIEILRVSVSSGDAELTDIARRVVDQLAREGHEEVEGII